MVRGWVWTWCRFGIGMVWACVGMDMGMVSAGAWVWGTGTCCRDAHGMGTVPVLPAAPTPQHEAVAPGRDPQPRVLAAGSRQRGPAGARPYFAHPMLGPERVAHGRSRARAQRQLLAGGCAVSPPGGATGSGAGPKQPRHSSHLTQTSFSPQGTSHPCPGCLLARVSVTAICVLGRSGRQPRCRYLQCCRGPGDPPRLWGWGQRGPPSPTDRGAAPAPSLLHRLHVRSFSTPWAAPHPSTSTVAVAVTSEPAP